MYVYYFTYYPLTEWKQKQLNATIASKNQAVLESQWLQAAIKATKKNVSLPKSIPESLFAALPPSLIEYLDCPAETHVQRLHRKINQAERMIAQLAQRQKRRIAEHASVLKQIELKKNCINLVQIRLDHLDSLLSVPTNALQGNLFSLGEYEGRDPSLLPELHPIPPLKTFAKIEDSEKEVCMISIYEAYIYIYMYSFTYALTHTYIRINYIYTYNICIRNTNIIFVFCAHNIYIYLGCQIICPWTRDRKRAVSIKSSKTTTTRRRRSSSSSRRAMWKDQGCDEVSWLC